MLDVPSDDVIEDPAVVDTNYTKGLFKDNVYVNDYAGLKINVPGNLNHFAESYEEKQERIEGITDEDDIIREKSRVMDACFANAKEAVYIFYANTDIGFPGVEDISEEYVLESYKEWEEGLFKKEGKETSWEDSKKVKLGKDEVTRKVVHYDESSFDCLYAKKLDDKLMCWIYITTCLPERTPEYYEALFD